MGAANVYACGRLFTLNSDRSNEHDQFALARPTSLAVAVQLAAAADCDRALGDHDRLAERPLAAWPDLEDGRWRKRRFGPRGDGQRRSRAALDRADVCGARSGRGENLSDVRRAGADGAARGAGTCRPREAHVAVVLEPVGLVSG